MQYYRPADFGRMLEGIALVITHFEGAFPHTKSAQHTPCSDVYRLWQKAANQHTKIVVLASDASVDDVQNFISAQGMNDLLPKITICEQNGLPLTAMIAAIPPKHEMRHDETLVIGSINDDFATVERICGRVARVRDFSLPHRPAQPYLVLRADNQALQITV